MDSATAPASGSTPSAGREPADLREFTREVTLAVLAQTDATAPRPGELLPDAEDRLHQALMYFYEKCDREPAFFRDIHHGVAWILATFRNLRLWESTAAHVPLDEAYAIPAAPAPELADIVSAIPRSTESLSPESQASAFTPPSPADPADVILQYYAGPDAPRSGRLGIGTDAMAVVQWMAEFGIVQPGQHVSTHVWTAIAGELGVTNDAAQDVYQRAKLAFAVVYYVVGALGPAGALASVDALHDAVATFRARFSGQSAWSVLKFAAHCAVPRGTYAQVSAPLYAAAIRSHPAQAARLGATAPGPSAADLLDPIEHQAAAVFGRDFPRCVLADDAGRHPSAAPHPLYASPPAGGIHAVPPAHSNPEGSRR